MRNWILLEQYLELFENTKRRMLKNEPSSYIIGLTPKAKENLSVPGSKGSENPHSHGSCH